MQESRVTTHLLWCGPHRPDICGTRRCWKQIRSSCGHLTCISSRRCKLPDHAEQNKQYRISVKQLAASLEIAINSGMKETVKNQQRRAMKWYGQSRAELKNKRSKNAIPASVRFQVTAVNDYEECFYMRFAALWSGRYKPSFRRYKPQGVTFLLSRKWRQYTSSKCRHRLNRPVLGHIS